VIILHERVHGYTWRNDSPSSGQLVLQYHLSIKGVFGCCLFVDAAMGDGRRVVTLRFLQNNDYSVFFYCIIILLRLLLVLE
jgi:hypothetical protein